MIRTLIVEDEADAANRLETMLKRVAPDLKVIGRTDSVESSVAWLNRHPHPDLLLLDIQLGDGQSFEIFKMVNIESFVIFTTAYDEYAIRAFELNSIDYLLKPVREEKLIHSIQKFRKLSHKPHGTDFLQLLSMIEQRSDRYKKRFMVSVGEKIKSIDVQDVALFYSMDKSTYLCTTDNRHYPLDFSLDHLEELLDPDRFFRINRQYMLSFQAIDKIVVLPKSRLRILTLPVTKEELLVSTSRTHQFRQWLDK